ncbi:MAG: hypothetical protein ACLR1T_00195 [Evtepia gabavorous]
MLCKLILRNVHRSARDYGIYLVTLILSVGMFYGFLSLSSSHYQAALPARSIWSFWSAGCRWPSPCSAYCCCSS